MYKVTLDLGNNSQSMRQSTLPFKTQQEALERDKRKEPANDRRSKPLSNHKGGPIEALSHHSSTPDKMESKRGRGQAKRNEEASKAKK